MCISKAESKELIPLTKRRRPPGSYGAYRKVRIGADPEFELHKNGEFSPPTKSFLASEHRLARMETARPVNSGRV
jgi:hypothetical protein